LAYLCDTNDQNENDRDQELADVGSFGTPLQVIATPTNDNGDTNQRQWRHQPTTMATPTNDNGDTIVRT
jgi:hypothetical protein